jgi:hypothetical protein
MLAAFTLRDFAMVMMVILFLWLVYIYLHRS